MRVFAFAGGSHAERAGLLAAFEAMQPDLVFDDMRELPDLLAGGAARDRRRQRGASWSAPSISAPAARAPGFSTRRGNLLGRADYPIVMNRPQPGHAEHDSEDIWRAACAATRGALANAGAAAAEIVGISFDATCSLVVRDRAGAQLGVSTGGGERWDTIVWLDHRALAEADDCTATGHRVLDYLGGVMSPEMQTPKLMWIKRNLPDVWERAGQFFDLADFLTYRASGSNARSQCTLACKWTYLAHEDDGWQQDFFEAVGIPDMLARGDLPEQRQPRRRRSRPADAGGRRGARPHHRLPRRRRPDRRLCRRAWRACRLHRRSRDDRPPSGADCRHVELRHGDVDRAALVRRRLGPVFRRRAAGALAVRGRPVGDRRAARSSDPLAWRRRRAGRRHARQDRRARHASCAQTEGLDLAGRLHVLPDFHGNRSPLADPHAIGVVSGLTLDATFDSLCKLYWRTCVGIALGVRHILDALNERGYVIDTLHVTGGHTRNPLLMELYSDATGCAVVEPQAADAVLLGTAMVAATAGGLYPDLDAACLAMQQGGTARDARHQGARALRSRLPHLPRNAPPAAGAGCDGRRWVPDWLGYAARPLLQLLVVARERRQFPGKRGKPLVCRQQPAGIVIVEQRLVVAERLRRRSPARTVNMRVSWDLPLTRMRSSSTTQYFAAASRAVCSPSRIDTS